MRDQFFLLHYFFKKGHTKTREERSSDDDRKRATETEESDRDENRTDGDKRTKSVSFARVRIARFYTRTVAHRMNGFARSESIRYGFVAPSVTYVTRIGRAEADRQDEDTGQK